MTLLFFFSVLVPPRQLYSEIAPRAKQVWRANGGLVRQFGQAIRSTEDAQLFAKGYSVQAHFH